MQSTFAVHSSASDARFHLLSFESPDSYVRASGIATRITGLREDIADACFETHLWFVSDPQLSDHEDPGQLGGIVGANGSVVIIPPVCIIGKRAKRARLQKMVRWTLLASHEVMAGNRLRVVCALNRFH